MSAMLVEEETFRTVLRAASEGSVGFAVRTFAKRCRVRDTCGQAKPDACIKCLEGAVKAHGSELANKRIAAWRMPERTGPG